MAYNAINNRIIFQMASKSMPPVPMTFAMIPSDNFVVACPRIFGPIIAKTVDPTAKIITINILR